MVVVLGEYRASEAVPILVENLALDSAATGMLWNALLPREEFEEKAGAVSIALQKIGSAAIPTLLDKLRRTEDENEIEKCVRICAGIDGADVAQFRLKQSLIGEVDQARRGRIEHALVVLTKVQKEYIR